MYYLLWHIASFHGGFYCGPGLGIVGLLCSLHLYWPLQAVMPVFRSFQISHPASLVFQHRQPVVPHERVSLPPPYVCVPSQLPLTTRVKHTLP